MKRIFLLILSLALLVSCQRENASDPNEDLVAQAKVFKKNDKGRFVYARSRKPGVPKFISRMNIADLSEVQGMIDSGHAVLSAGDIGIKASEPQKTP